MKEAIDDALGRIAASGELKTILEGSHIWNARQERLASWSAADQAKMLGQPPPPPVFNRGHVVLFLKGAAITLFVSALAMVIAVALALKAGRIVAQGEAGSVLEAP